MKRIFHNFKALLFTSSLMLSLYAQAATITVTNGNDTGAGSLRAAIASAAAGDVIDFSGVTTVTLTSAELIINKNLTINGGTGVNITRSGATEFRIFNVSGAATTVVFNKLSITNGKNASQSGGVENNGTLTLNDCIIANNESPQGSGLQNNGTLTMNRCFVHSNSNGVGCGLMIYGSMTTLNNCVFTNNRGDFAIDMSTAGTLNITNCTIAKNSGGIKVSNGSATVTLKNTIVAENTNTTDANIRNNVSASSDYNLIGTEGGNGGLTNGVNNNLVGESPLFANSTDPDGIDNIFGTADDGLMLVTCSPSLNAGNTANAPVGTDIVGNSRTFGANVDMGAYEVQAASTPIPTITLGTIPTTILAGTTTFSIPYTATGTPTTYSISGTGFTTIIDATLPNSPITVNLNASTSVNIDFTLTVKNAAGCTSSANTGKITMITPLTDACATANFIGIAPIAPTTTTAGVGGKGGIYTYTVPAGVTAIRLDARGAKGGSSPNHFNNTFVGGQGGRVQATYAVTPGDVLYILVGGKGGNGSIDNGVQVRTASGGGGATVVSKGPIGTGTLLLVAGGGGGAGHSGGGGSSNNNPGSGSGSIGAGGASFSANGGNSTVGDIGERDCGQGGQALNAGGNGGANACFRPETNGGGYGGGGAGNYSTPNNNAGGGGGGGYVGGNAGGTAGGNGGSSYNAPSASNVTINNHSDDNGSVKITIVGSISYTGSPFCKSLMATSAPTTTGYTGGIFSSTSGLTIDATTGVINPSTSTTGTYSVSYNVSGSNTCPVVATTTVTIIALPSAQASNTGPYSVGQTIQLSATGGLTYSWSGPNGFTSNIPNPLINNTLQSNEGVYTVIVSNGICTATATTNVVVIDPCVQIMQYSYVQAGNPYEALFDLTNGMNIAQNTNPTSILVRPICPSATIESVNMTISGPVNYTILQNIQPFSLFDNFGNNVYGQVLPAGTYTLTVTGYSQDNRNGGITYGPVTTTFTIVGNIPTISMPTFTGTSFCSGSGLRVNFSTTGTFSTSNQFQVLLSDANGNFNHAQVIGTSASAGNVSCTIPSQATGGVNYRLKVISTDPAASGNYNPTFVIIHPKDLNLVSPTDDMNTNIGTKQASQSITATNKVNSTANVIYQAGKSITFNAGFEAKAGSVFKAHIDGCGNITN